MGTKTLQEIIEHREEAAEEVQEIIGNAAKAWGCMVESILIKDMKFSQDLQDSLSSVAKQKRLAEAKVLSAKYEVESAQLMRAAADQLASEPAMQIRFVDLI